MLTSRKKVCIIHGTESSPEGNWFSWLQSELRLCGHSVIVPRFPTPGNQSLPSWKSVFAAEYGPLSFDSILIGHSIGAAFVLNLLSESLTPIVATFLVAGFLGRIENPFYDSLNSSFFETKFDWKALRSRAGVIKLYCGDNDPYVPLAKGQELANLLSSPLEIVENGGHLNSESGFSKFEQLLNDVDIVARAR